MKVLIGYDGSECAAATLGDLPLAGLPDEVEAEVLSVADVWLPPPEALGLEPAVKVTPLAVERARSQAEKKLAEMEAIAHQGAERLKAIFPAWKVTAEAVADSPSWAVIKRASDWPADLVVVGSHGYAGFNRLTLGSVSHKIVTESACSVRIARIKERTPDRPLRLVIGLDGSLYADLAVQTVRNRRWPRGTEAHLITAIDEKVVTAIFQPPEILKQWVGEHDEEPLAWVGRMIGHYRAQLEAAGFKVRSLVNYGDPKTMLIEEAANCDADCIFIGAKGHGIIERVLIGSVSTSIIAKADCSVEVIR